MNGVGGDVDVHFAEMPLHRLEGAARGDAHLLVVVAGRAAARESVAEPIAVFGRYGVRRVGEGRRALVGGDHEIGIVVLVPHHRLGRHDLVAVEIVGDVEEARDEDAVGGEPLGRDRLAASGRQPFRHEAALGADRNDHGVLDLLRLGEAEDLGAEVLRPVGPADAAARHLAEAEMDAVDARAVHEDFAERTRRAAGLRWRGSRA